MVQAVTFNSIIVATNACRGEWNRHAVALSDIFFTQLPFFYFLYKNKHRLCPLPMRKFWRPSLRSLGQNNVGISKY